MGARKAGATGGSVGGEEETYEEEEASPPWTFLYTPTTS